MKFARSLGYLETPWSKLHLMELSYLSTLRPLSLSEESSKEKCKWWLSSRKDTVALMLTSIWKALLAIVLSSMEAASSAKMGKSNTCQKCIVCRISRLLPLWPTWTRSEHSDSQISPFRNNQILLMCSRE